MQVHNGVSQLSDGAAAVAAIVSQWPRTKPSFIFVFHSTQQDSNAVAQAVEKHYPGVPCAGCSTSGEHMNGAHYNGSLVMAGIWSPEIRWQATVLDKLNSLDETRARKTVDQMLQNFALDRDHINPDRQFCVTFIDGLSMKEELVSALVADALEGIPLLGGSAGDDLKFKETRIIVNGKSYPQAAALIMADSQDGFRIIKHQHFLKTPRQLVVTRVDTAQRRVYELDGMPALEAYAASLGMPVSQVTADVAFVNPLLFRVNNELYVRSVQKIESDGSIVFYCGVEEGMVLEIGDHLDMPAALQKDIQSFQSAQQPAEFFLACNCILRALEAGKDNNFPQLGNSLQSISRNIIGFDTYGEQLNGLHINQTLVGIALGRKAA
ncbi:FIST N-terminal domain-containing protein [Oligoflexus tunisiensis]|uniref:FIST N-terminal domain-containing protein n=1 Tax=Oligoflexus tunisiensis TaxID=708132 RepID=UPI00159F172D|nr:FIST N-terminal domain-containing protein [Oligoflexus tunisiensis]